MLNLIAHRALDNNKYQENTKEAINDSLSKDYISGIEIDARMTKDKKIVIIHDMTINRVSNGTGFISNQTLKELKKHNFGTEENPSKISTLKEILKEINTNKIILIELKHESSNKEEYITQINNVLKNYNKENIYVMSFDPILIKLLKETNQNIKCGLLVSKIINITTNYEDYDFIAISSYSIDKVKNIKKPIFVWALKTKKRIKELNEKMSKNTYYIVDKPRKYI